MKVLKGRSIRTIAHNSKDVEIFSAITKLPIFPLLFARLSKAPAGAAGV
jgi:hypothetical protein